MRVDFCCTMTEVAFEDFDVEVDIDIRIWIDVEALELKCRGEWAILYRFRDSSMQVCTLQA